MKCDERTLASLEMPTLLLQLARKTRSEPGRSFFMEISPLASIQQAFERQKLIASYTKYCDAEGPFPWDESFREVEPLIENASESGMLSGEELLHVRNLLRLFQRVRETVTISSHAYPGLASLLEGISDMGSELEKLKVISDDGALYDHATPRLAETRAALRQMRARGRRKGNELAVSMSAASLLQDKLLHVRRGRFALLVRQEGVNRVGGIVLDRSGSGSSVYMEPRELVEINNQVEMLTADERDEEHRVLRGVTRVLVDRRKALCRAERALGLLDVVHVCSGLMSEEGWTLPQLDERPRFHLVKARNPLLGERCVPLTIHCGERFRQLVVTGPNTGGKTVALKTTAVIIFLALCGLPVPVTEGSMVGAVDAIMADIGDEQGIEQNLSTFSSHIKRTIHMMETAAPSSLLLLDELGAGTDPQEGAALGIAVLQELRQKQCLVLATTHHNPVKAWAISEPGVETASVEFDPVSLSPTFRLMMGIPGRSNALLVAGKLGMPESVIEKARDTLRGGHASVEEIVAELQEKQVHLEAMEAGLAEERRRLSALTRESEDLQNSIRSSRDSIISEADMKAQKIIAEAEESAKELVKGLEGAARSAASRHMEDRRKETRRMKKEISGREEERIRTQAQQAGGPPSIGDHALIAGTSTRGVVERINGKKAELRAGLLKIEVPVGKLIRTAKGPELEPPLPCTTKVSRPKHVPSSIMVRGMTIDEAMPNVARYLDQAFRAGYGEVTVIHGRGEGILRREVHALCARLKYVSEYRLGGPGEGGYGVTVVSFRK